jgi:hypothetical protein
MSNSALVAGDQSPRPRNRHRVGSRAYPMVALATARVRQRGGTTPGGGGGGSPGGGGGGIDRADGVDGATATPGT